MPPPWASKFFRFHAVFGKIWRVHAPPGGFTPPLGKILDPPLLIIKVPRSPLHPFPKSLVHPNSMNKLPLTSQQILQELPLKRGVMYQSFIIWHKVEAGTKFRRLIIFKNLVTLACVVWSWWIQIVPFRIWHAFHLCYFDAGIRVVKNVSFHTRVIYDVVQRNQIVFRNYCIVKWWRLATIHFCLCKNIYYAYIYILFWKFRLLYSR